MLKPEGRIEFNRIQMKNTTRERKTSMGQLNRLVHLKKISKWNNIIQYFKLDPENIFDKACQNSGERKRKVKYEREISMYGDT